MLSRAGGQGQSGPLSAPGQLHNISCRTSRSIFPFAIGWGLFSPTLVGHVCWLWMSGMWVTNWGLKVAGRKLCVGSAMSCEQNK